MRYIYSKKDSKIILAIINRLEELTEDRKNLVPENEFLQVSFFSMDKGKTFKAHKHLYQEKISKITQESFVIIRGSIKAIIYDLDDKMAEEVILKQGDCIITLYGGHNYLGLEDDTVIYEHKLGPYYGVEKDKIFIDDAYGANNG